jgi:hypothetical protein
MKHVTSKKFWYEVEKLEQLPLGGRPLIEIDLQAESTFTQVSTSGGRVVGEEITCHRTGKSRCYLAVG